MRLNDNILTLVPFQESDFKSLQCKITSARFLLQWAGSKYKFPLTWEQINERILRIKENHKCIYVFKAAYMNEMVGFIEIEVRDFVLKIASIQSVLIFDQFRGKGFGNLLMLKAVDFSFGVLQMNKLNLGVFDFNTSAISCYKSVGFAQDHFLPNNCSFENESWNLLLMSLDKVNWINK